MKSIGWTDIKDSKFSLKKEVKKEKKESYYLPKFSLIKNLWAGSSTVANVPLYLCGVRE